jgi:tRNA G18 (ribose-2'-O)-methylase SpoU
LISLHNIDPSRGLCWLALNSVHSPGNLGTIMRTAEAVSAAGIIMAGDNVDPFHPATVRASMGSIFSDTGAHQFEVFCRLDQRTAVFRGRIVAGGTT